MCLQSTHDFWKVIQQTGQSGCLCRGRGDRELESRFKRQVYFLLNLLSFDEKFIKCVFQLRNFQKVKLRLIFPKLKTKTKNNLSTQEELASQASVLSFLNKNYFYSDLDLSVEKKKSGVQYNLPKNIINCEIYQQWSLSLQWSSALPHPHHHCNVSMNVY